MEGDSWARKDSEIALARSVGFVRAIQIRADMFQGDRPNCPRRCLGRVHRHGSYHRYAHPSGTQTFPVQRYRCAQCGLSLSVLPADRLPYRAVPAGRLEAFFNEQAEAGSGPDPPPDELEAGCLRRAWARFQTRVPILKKAFGLLVHSVMGSAAALWKQMRLAKTTLQGILHYLARADKRSLLGDYRCLQWPS